MALDTLTFHGRLPGVLCETSAPANPTNPLRLDVAGFVGFAERGPIDLPVMVEDLSQYQLIFGGDLALAVHQGLPIYAHLPRAVEAFFENGGARCYVVRVAGADHRPNRFHLPGLLYESTSQGWEPVPTAAAWSGRWSDFMRIGTSLLIQPLKIRDDDSPLALSGETISQGTFELPLRVASADAVRPGDLLRFYTGVAAAGVETVPSSHVIYFRVGAVSEVTDLPPSLLGVPIIVQPEADSARLFSTAPDEPNLTQLELLTERGWLTLDLADVRWLAPDAATEGEPYRLSFPVSTDVEVEIGDLLRLQGIGAQAPIFVTADRLQRTYPDDASQVRLLIDSYQPLQSQSFLSAPAYTITQVDLLSFDLLIREGEETLEVRRDLRFSPGRGYWRDALAAPIDDTQPTPTSFQIDHFSGRSLRLADADVPDDAILIPLGIGAAPRFVGVLPDAQPTGKDGLDVFTPVALFMDPDFLTVTTRALLNTANDRLYLAPQPRRLSGMHSLIPVPEVAQMALPDLAHLGWEVLDIPTFVDPEPPEEPAAPSEGFHDCLMEEPVVENDEEAGIPVLMLEPDSVEPEPSIQALLADLPEQISPADYDESALRQVQQGLIRLCAGRADAIAILNLPQHYDRQAVEQWQQRLVNTPEFFDGMPLSYAAVYHGWTGLSDLTTSALTPIRYIPPDGVACGMIAIREIQRGAWIAPANLALRTVADLEPNFSDTQWAALYNRQINIIRQQPGRYTLMSALTLARDRTLVQLSVRRLLIFLRKLALREGQRYVFETHNERFRGLVQTYFEGILSRLLERGGIQAFQVVTSEEVNTVNDYDNGRFIIALKIAPTLPIEFITVILLRSGDDGIDIIER